MAGTTPKARQLGAELRAAREAAGLSVRALATQLEVSHATLSRWETGERSPKPELVAAYLAKVNAPAASRAQLVEFARDPDGPHWLSIGMPEQRRQLDALIAMESTANAVTTVAPMLVPGLIQTADYARAIMVAGNVSASEINTRVAVRIGRRDAVTRKRPVHLRAFIGELVLMQAIGDSSVMSEQLNALLDFGERANIEVRVIPARRGWHPGLEGPFSLMEFTDRVPVVNLENRISSLLLHEPEDVQAYEEAVEAVGEVALNESESRDLITNAINKLE